MKKQMIIYLTVLWCILLLGTAQAQTILFVPADDRPVSLEYAVDTVKAAHTEVLTPPVEYLAGRGRAGNPEKLWEWVMNNSRQADAMVLSADTLIYGGLVDSRTHYDEQYVLDWRLRHFQKLKAANSNARVYVFSTVMRTPKASFGGVEPSYYEKYGVNIFRMTMLEDKKEVKGLSADEQRELKSLTETIPKDALNDWMKRRAKNFKINAGLIDMTKAGLFNYLIIGRDDTSPYSQSHKEWRYLDRIADGLPKSQYASFPGADQLGMVLLARAYNDLTMHIPVVEVRYTEGAGAGTVPTYEDQPVGKTINDHIIASGGVVLSKPRKPDLILMVNTPVNGVTGEAEWLENIPAPTDSTRKFVADVAGYLYAGKGVAVADIAFANGADNALMAELEMQHLLDKLTAYSGWNTASNTLGYAIGQGIMAKDFTDKDRKRLLAIRYLDDWAYQANIRRQVDYEVLYPQGGNLMYLNDLAPVITNETQRRIREFAHSKLWDIPSKKIIIDFPWNRMFEIRAVVEQ